MTQPRLSQLPLWERHERRVLAILRRALDLLRTRSPVVGEPALNRELYFCLLEANRECQAAGDGWFDHPPTYEARNPPTPDTEDSASERKIPDFHWGYVDHLDPDPRRSARMFVIECKRLGHPTSSGWVFNVHYVNDGVQRFVDPNWRYGKDVRSGAMVGYVESMPIAEILAEVNATGGTKGLPPITPAVANPPLYEMEHSLKRAFAISPFVLRHLWVEMPGP